MKLFRNKIEEVKEGNYKSVFKLIIRYITEKKYNLDGNFYELKTIIWPPKNCKCIVDFDIAYYTIDKNNNLHCKIKNFSVYLDEKLEYNDVDICLQLKAADCQMQQNLKDIIDETNKKEETIISIEQARKITKSWLKPYLIWIDENKDGKEK